MKIPTSWAEVTLKQYIEVADINAIDMDELDKQVKILSILSNTPEDIICYMPLPQLKEAIRACQFIYTKQTTGSIKQFLRIGANRFEVNTNLKTITGGEYIDLTGFIKDKNDVTKNLPQIIAIFLHPVNWLGMRKKSAYHQGCQTLESRARTAKLIQDKLMMNEVMILSGFFLNSWKVLTKATLNYSELQMKMTKKQLEKLIKEDSKSTGAGT